jgi:hypothetical protein
VLARLERGDECAWCTLVVTATADDDESLVGRAVLGAVSLSEDHPYGPALESYVQEQYPELWTEALDDLNATLERSVDQTDPKYLALALHLGALPSTISESRGAGSDMYECETEQGEYLVLDDSEADTVADEQLESYIDEYILPECPHAIAPYFDRDAWKRAALLSDGRGHTISSYDGEEHEVEIDSTCYYIYRVN